MSTYLHFYTCPLLLAMLAGCASQGEPPVIALDEPVQAQRLPEPPKPIEVVAVPKPLALPAQLKPLLDGQASKRALLRWCPVPGLHQPGSGHCDQPASR